jgi:hypothetical protein
VVAVAVEKIVVDAGEGSVDVTSASWELGVAVLSVAVDTTSAAAADFAAAACITTNCTNPKA